MSEAVASLVGEAWPHILNILSGFRKTGIFPFNPGEISDCMLAPSKSVCKAASKPLFSQEKLELFEKRYEEGYDMPDPEYSEWCKSTHPDTSSSSAATRSALSDITNVSDLDAISHCTASTSCESKSSRRKAALNSKAVCISDLSVLKDQEKKKEEIEQEKARKRQERAEKKMKRKQRKENA